MLSREVFKKGMLEIKNAFEGFNLTEEKADIWYKYSKDLTNSKFLRCIENCIKYCKRTPTLADILDLKDYYNEQKFRV